MTKTIVRISTDINKILTCPCARGVRVDAIKQDMGKEVEVFAQPKQSNYCDKLLWEPTPEAHAKLWPGVEYKIGLCEHVLDID